MAEYIIDWLEEARRSAREISACLVTELDFYRMPEEARVPVGEFPDLEEESIFLVH